MRPKRDFWSAFKEKVNKNKIGGVTIGDLKFELRNEFDRYQSYDMLDVSIKVPIFMVGRTQAGISEYRQVSAQCAFHTCNLCAHRKVV